MLAAMPMHSVDTSGLMNCIVSYTDRPALTLPPGELMYRKISLSGFSLSRNSICATTTLAVWSLTGPTKKTMRSRSKA